MKFLKSKAFKIVLFIIVLFFLWTNYVWKFFSQGFAGSYPSVEAWDLKIKEKRKRNGASSNFETEDLLAIIEFMNMVEI